MRKYSFIIPLYNASEWMDIALNSVVRQRYKNWEAVLIDDGSTDDTLRKMNEFSSNYPDSFIITSIQNSGPAMARRKGVELSTGSFIAFLDSDDYISEDYLNEINSILEKFKDADMIIPELMSEKRDGSWESFNNQHGLKYEQILSGSEAFRRTFPWTVHGFAVYRRNLFLKASSGDITFNRYNADEYITRLFLLLCEDIVVSKGRYYHSANMGSLTKRISTRKLGMFETERRLIELVCSRDTSYLDQVISDSYRKTFTSFFTFLLQKELFSKKEFVEIELEHLAHYDFLSLQRISFQNLTNSRLKNLVYQSFYFNHRVVYFIAFLRRLLR